MKANILFTISSREAYMSATATTPLTESFGALNLPLGGKHGYRGVRSGQGSKKDGFQGYTPRKTHFTKVYKTAHEAAVNLDLLVLPIVGPW